MRLEVLHVPDCPHLPVLLSRLREATDLPVTTRVTDDAGSPTLLVDGYDPFPSGESALACRFYRDDRGRLDSAPSVDQLRDALAVAADPLVAWSRRAAPTDPTERAVHRAVLRGFAATGRPRATAELAELVGGDATAILAALHDRDVLRLDAAGRIDSAYPFSTRPTRHRVRIDDRVDAYAMCAVDALGIAPMLGTDTRITSADPATGEPVTVTSTAGWTSWDPAEAVVFIAAAAGSGPSADTCCASLDFFARPATAHAWTAGHDGRVLTRSRAERLAAVLFGPVLLR